MKNLLKITGIIAVIAMILLALTGCGGNKLVGKLKEDDYKGKVVATFDKDDKLKKMVITMTYKDTDDAKDSYEDAKETFESGKVKRSGKKVTVTLKAKDFAEMSHQDEEDIDKDIIEKFLKTMGFELDD